MSAGDDVRKRISDVELALRNARTENALHAIVDALKEIADALDHVERHSRGDC
jgi:hypothetical protein